jgi:hypothetical protein
MNHKFLKCRLDQQKKIFLTHRKKTSTKTTIMKMMKKNQRYGRMVRRCTYRFHLSFYTLPNAGGRRACACNAKLVEDLMQRCLHHPHLYLNHRLELPWPHSKPT